MLQSEIGSVSPSVVPLYQQVKPFSMTTAGYIIPTITGTISALGSLLILNAIRLSNQKLTTTYHRIMALMSVFDIMASVSMALTTLPMPSDDMLRFAGPMLGNHLTCQTQGYMMLIGLNGSAPLYMCLSWYFVCRMTLQISIEKMKKWIEPLFLIFSFCVAIAVPSFHVLNDMISTMPRNPFCLLAPVHSDCTFTIDEHYFVCDYELLKKSQIAFTLSFCLVLFYFIMIFIAMVMVIWTISNKNQDIRKAVVNFESNHDTNTEVDDHDMDISELRYSRVLVVQALMYIFAFFITWIFAIISNVLLLDSSNVSLVFGSIFFPMQGFWNLIIFVYDKAYLVHQSDEQMSFWNRVNVVLFSPSSIPTVIFHPSLLRNSIHDHHHIDENGNPIVAGTIMNLSHVKTPSDSKSQNIFNEPQSLEKSHLNSKSSSQSNHSQHSIDFVCNGVEYLGNDVNQRFYINTNGLRRTGQVEDTRLGRMVVNYGGSVESPVGCISDSNDDASAGTRSLGLSLFLLKDIVENDEEGDDDDDKESDIDSNT